MNGNRFAALCLLLPALLPIVRATPAVAAPPRNIIPPAGVSEVKTLSQNWSDAEADWFYTVPQGSKIMPYVWFLHLEQPGGGEKSFRDTEFIRELGYLPRKPDPATNRDGLPVGFTKDEDHLGLTCAACHTGQLHHGGKAYLIDGAPTLGDVSKFQRQLLVALQETHDVPAKFSRFAAKVGGDAGQLKAKLLEVIATRKEYNDRNLPHGGASEFGPGRVDAFGAILNQATAKIANEPDNVRPANAPVSYPFLWDTPQHDVVQWNGAAKNFKLNTVGPSLFGTADVGALGRNAGEVVGVFGVVDATNRLKIGYPSSVNTANLIQIEQKVSRLWSPQWPVEFGAIDEALRARGEVLFETHCASCHPSIQRKDPNRTVTAVMQAVGTDPTMARNFAVRKGNSGRLFTGRLVKIPGLNVFFGQERGADFLTHVVQRVLIERAAVSQTKAALEGILQGYDLDYSVPAQVEIDGVKFNADFRQLEIEGDVWKGGAIHFAKPSDLRVKKGDEAIHFDPSIDPDKIRALKEKFHEHALEKLVKPKLSVEDSKLSISLVPLKEAKITFAYKGRPLNGIWATAPYLHNGSVPNLDELLKPAGRRKPDFRLGSRNFDPKKVGYEDAGDFVFDTSKPGNLNTGHEYGDKVFTDDERKQLIEYMKSL